MDETIFELPLRPAAEHPVELEPRRVLGGPPGGPLARRMSLGEPVLAPLEQPEGERAAVDRYLLDTLATHDFFELHLVMTLYPDPGEPFEDAAMGVSLTTPDGRERPIAWSLFPLRSAVPVKVTNNVGINAKLGFAEPSLAHNTEHSRDDVFVLGLGERESDFEWRLRRTRAAELSGVQRMFAVVKARKGTPFEMTMIVSASVRRSRLGLSRFRARLPEVIRNVSWPAR
ncbi:hypothetical protein ACFFV7_21130 [Nonomuraea spiralis]|uniref:Uncharacterized protein n=1 Tax=Nonomuraea spiralis TaxID=46182 RepID=A0ABV5IH75_9ACTN|nr:hypothetical protein [Nonomuraea spiralis]GGS98263.1 hypothetical protein GCM10010176_047740 [Nonomuraea spiralis]